MSIEGLKYLMQLLAALAVCSMLHNAELRVPSRTHVMQQLIRRAQKVVPGIRSTLSSPWNMTVNLQPT